MYTLRVYLPAQPRGPERIENRMVYELQETIKIHETGDTNQGSGDSRSSSRAIYVVVNIRIGTPSLSRDSPRHNISLASSELRATDTQHSGLSIIERAVIRTTRRSCHIHNYFPR
jgi:hypothetical protein